uniref:Uncharacterized protein n=1 Tax=Arundo donax TaxID=35708 RepID=A0A0A8ZSW3_ARUDO
MMIRHLLVVSRAVLKHHISHVGIAHKCCVFSCIL